MVKNILVRLLMFVGITAFGQDCSTFVVESKSVPANCHGGNGKILLTKVEGGSGYGTYKYEWTNGDTTQNLMSAPSGMYNVVVTDSNGCIIMLKDTILEPEQLVINSIVEPNNGYATIVNHVSGGVLPYTYKYYVLKDKKGKKSVPKEIDSFDNLRSGYYRVRVIDSVGCTMETEGWVEIKDVDVADNIYLKQYPNPINIYCVIEYKVPSNRIYRLKIISFSTQEIIYDNVLDSNNNKLELLTVDYPNGTYNLMIMEGNKIKKSSKIIINH